MRFSDCLAPEWRPALGCTEPAATARAAIKAAAQADGVPAVGWIPDTDGIVGADGARSLAILERIARREMRSMDAEILRIMQEKLRWRRPGA